MRNGWLMVCGLACVVVADNGSAASVIEQTDGESNSVLYLENGMLRAGEAGEDAYALIDLANRSFVMVNPQEKTVLDMSASMWDAQAGGPGAAASPVDARLEEIGAGPTIAGYETVQYTLLADGKPCQDLYVSRQAFDDSGFDEVWARSGEAWKEMDADASDPCDLAEQKAVDYAEIGLPLKTVYRESQHAGQFEEVTRVEKSVQAPPGGFEVPAGYEVVSFEAMMGAFMDEDTGDDETWGDDGYEEYGDEEYADEAEDDQGYDDDRE